MGERGEGRREGVQEGGEGRGREEGRGAGGRGCGGGGKGRCRGKCPNAKRHSWQFRVASPAPQQAPDPLHLAPSLPPTPTSCLHPNVLQTHPISPPTLSRSVGPFIIPPPPPTCPPSGHLVSPAARCALINLLPHQLQHNRCRPPGCFYLWRQAARFAAGLPSIQRRGGLHHSPSMCN